MFDGARQRPLGIAPAPGQRRGADRTVDDALPEPPQRAPAASRLRRTHAEAAHQRGEIADPRRQQRFDAFAQPPRQHRRRAAGADRDHDIAAIDNGGEDERRKLRPVDDIDRNVLAPCQRRDIVVERVAGRRHHGDAIGKIGLARIGETNFERPGQRGGQYFFGDADVLGIPAHPRACGAQQAELIERRRPGPNQAHHAFREIEKHRQETHRGEFHAMEECLSI